MKRILIKIVLSFLATFIIKNISAQNINTFAGNGVIGFSGDGGPAISAQLCNPYGVAMDVSGNTYIATHCSHRVRMVNPAGVITTIAGTGVAGFGGDGGSAVLAQLNQPRSIVIDASGNIYILEQGGNRIRKINSSGIISTFAGTGVAGFSGDGGPATNAQLNNPYSLGIDFAGNIYVAEPSNNRVRKINTSGIISTFAGNGLAGFSGDGGPATNAQFNGAQGVAVDPSGNVYIADGSNYRIRKVNTSGIISTFAGTGASGFSGDGGLATSAALNLPNAVGVDAFGNVYISDFFNYRIRKVNTLGVISTIAGNGTGGYSGDGGPAVNAQINGGLYGYTFDAAGNVIFSDGFNSRIRIISLSTHIKDLDKKNDYVLFPNPACEQITISSSAPIKIIKIFSVDGKLVLEKIINDKATTQTLNISQLQQGIYLMSCITTEGEKYFKVVKE